MNPQDKFQILQLFLKFSKIQLLFIQKRIIYNQISYFSPIQETMLTNLENLRDPAKISMFPNSGEILPYFSLIYRNFYRIFRLAGLPIILGNEIFTEIEQIWT